jgi:NSS family neurotransmitter:Na+ symporter
LIQGDSLIFNVLPALFDKIEIVGPLVASAFFALMVIAALTSSISMLEVPVAYLVDSKGIKRDKATILLMCLVLVTSGIIVFNFEALFGLVITATTQYSQPILGLILCIFAGWVWRRDQILSEIKQGDADIEKSVFWKIWPWYIKFVCPLVIVFMFYRSIA